METVNDLSEDVRGDIGNICLAIAELSVKPATLAKERTPIGFKKE